MSLHVTRPQFDQNDPKYFCCCGAIHIKKGARIVAVLLNVCIALNLIFSFTRNSTVAVYTVMSSAFAVVIFGSLLYGVFKEKRLYVLPYLLFQAISLAFTLILLFTILISLAVQSRMILTLAEDLWHLNPKAPQAEIDAELAAFTVVVMLTTCISILIQGFFGEVIYSFNSFLREREQSFNFNFDTSSFQTTPPASAGPLSQ